MLTGYLGLLLEAMQHVNRLIKFGDVNHPVNTVRIFDSDLSGASPHILEWLPVTWVKSRLHLAQLKARLPACLRGKVQKILVG
jgi:hypothetical protein